jgi:hypothetical protein
MIRNCTCGGVGQQVSGISISKQEQQTGVAVATQQQRPQASGTISAQTGR